MVAPLKNGNGHRSGHGGGGGRPYGLMLLLALGAAILGVMVLHKLREGRLFSLLVKEKDQELLALHLLLQREGDFNKEAQKKLEEMKTKLYSVKSQNSDVEGRLLEVESLVSSLKDEQKILESQLEEKRNEIKMLRQQQMMPTDEIGSREISNQKQGEIEDHLKRHLEEPASVWSVSSDDPSNPPINFTNAAKLEQRDDPDRSVEGAYQNKNETDTSSEQEKRILEDTADEGNKPLSISSSMNQNHGNEDDTFQGQRSNADDSAADHNVEAQKSTDEENDTQVVDGSHGSDDFKDGSDSGTRLKNSKLRKLRRRYRDLIRRFREEKNNYVEQNEVGAVRKKRNAGASEQAGQNVGKYGKQDEYVASRKEELLNMAANVTHSSLNVNAETKEYQDSEPDPDSSAGEVEVESSTEIKEIDEGSDHIEDEEETKSSKDDEHKDKLK